MQYLVVFQPNPRFASEGMPSDFTQMETEERAQAQRLYADGSLRQVWALNTQSRGAVVLFEADSEKHLAAIIESFPFIQADYAAHEIFPLAPYPAFAGQS